MAEKVVTGSDFKLWVEKDGDYVLIGCATDVSVNVSAGTISAACKASGGWSEAAPGQKSWTMSASGIYKVYTAPDVDGNYSASELFDNINEGDIVSLRIGTETVGEPIWSGTAMVSSWEMSGGTDDGATYTAEFQGTGPLTKTAVVATP